MKDDGWLYYLTYEYSENEYSPYIYYDAYNLKYKHLDGYDLPIIDDNSEIIDYFKNNRLPYLSLNQDYIADFDKLDQFFSIVDLSSFDINEINNIELEHIDKSHVIKLYNQVMSSNDLPDGKYGYLYQADIVQEDKEDGYQWQVGYFVSHGVVLYVRIDIVYDDGSYLSDILASDKANSDQISIGQRISEINDYILNNQSFEISNHENEIYGDIKFGRLYLLLQKIEDGSY